LIRNVSRRLMRLETRAQEIAAATPEPHTIVFHNVDMSISSTMHWESGKWVRTASRPIRR
jgi:hypothetical protein